MFYVFIYSIMYMSICCPTNRAPVEFAKSLCTGVGNNGELMHTNRGSRIHRGIVDGNQFVIVLLLTGRMTGIGAD